MKNRLRQTVFLKKRVHFQGQFYNLGFLEYRQQFPLFLSFFIILLLLLFLLLFSFYFTW